MIFKLSCSSLRFEKLISACLIATLVSVLAPLLLLFSLRYGIITNLENNLKSNPANLEIKMMTGGYVLKKDFFDSMKANPHVAFCLPLTRALSVTADVKYANTYQELDALPTAKDDPIVKLSGYDFELGDKEAFLSETLVNDLGIKVGDKFNFIIKRKNEQKEFQKSEQEFTLKGVIKKEYLSHKTIMVNLKTLIYMEDYKDGFNPPIFTAGDKPKSQRDTFARARIYVKTIDDVEPVSSLLRKNYEIRDKLSSIEDLKSISNVLSFIFTTIASVSVIGGILATMGLIFTNINRLLQSFALLSLTGISSSKILAIVIVQNIILSTLAYLVALGLFYSGMMSFNLYFKDLLGQNTLVSTLNEMHLLCGYLCTVGICIFISCVLWKIKLSKLEIAPVLRQI